MNQTENLNCRCCGGALDTFSNLTVCEHCGATNFISDVANKKIFQLNRANKLRQESEFDNAARIYDNILEEYGPTADILWYRTLCEYGIEYVPDPLSDKYIPTLHRINDESILDCSFFKQCIELSEGEQKDTLLKEAKYIDEVQTKYLNIAADESPYDVFICYKETDLDTGEETEDVLLAEELYNELSGMGYKVFFARKTLEEKLSIEYEPYIFAALKSAKAMAVIGTKAEYFSSVWVKNEWGRFLKLMEKHPEKQIFFACDDPEELPRAFAYKQAQILGEEGAIKNLANNVDSFLNGPNTPADLSLTVARDKMRQEVIHRLNAGEDFGTLALINEIIGAFPDYAEGYWLRMLYMNNAKPSEIRKLPRYLYGDRDYEMALSLAKGDLKEEYTEIGAICNENQKYQDEFSKIFKEKSIEYVNDFEKSELAQKKENILDKIRKYVYQVETYNDKLKYTFTIGYSLFYFGIFLMLLITAKYNGETAFNMGDTYHLRLVRNLFCSIFLLAGVIVGLSYNKFLDIAISVICGLLLIISIVFANQGFFFILFAILIPTAAFIFSAYNPDINEHKKLREDGSRKIKNELEKLQKLLSTEAKEDIRQFGEKLAEQFKEDKKIDSIIEINEQDYIKELEKLGKIYEYAKDEYTKYIEASFHEEKEEDKYDRKEFMYKTDSVIGFILLFTFSIPVIPVAISLVDLAVDKYHKRIHVGPILALFASIPMTVLYVWAMEFT